MRHLTVKNLLASAGAASILSAMFIGFIIGTYAIYIFNPGRHERRSLDS